jgi:hypothetical protein
MIKPQGLQDHGKPSDEYPNKRQLQGLFSALVSKGMVQQTKVLAVQRGYPGTLTEKVQALQTNFRTAGPQAKMVKMVLQGPQTQEMATMW